MCSLLFRTCGSGPWTHRSGPERPQIGAFDDAQGCVVELRRETALAELVGEAAGRYNWFTANFVGNGAPSGASSTRAWGGINLHYG
jgi:hypothetical protein